MAVNRGQLSVYSVGLIFLKSYSLEQSQISISATGFVVYFVTGCGLCCFNVHVNVRKTPTKWQTAYESYEFEIRNADTKLPWLFLKVSAMTFVFGAQDLLMYMLLPVVFGPVNNTRKSVSVGQCTQARIICWQRFVLAFIVVLACRIANLPTQPPSQVYTS